MIYNKKLHKSIPWLKKLGELLYLIIFVRKNREKIRLIYLWITFSFYLKRESKKE